jgi:hypothetical protein
MAANEIATLVTEASPYISAAVGAYGGTVLAKVKDDAADATVGLGQRILQRVFGRRDKGEALPGPVADLVAYPDDPDLLAALRVAIRRQLEADAALRAEVQRMLADAPHPGVTQRVRAGRDAYVAGRDMTVNRPVDEQ